MVEKMVILWKVTPYNLPHIILLKGNQFNTKVDYFLDVDRDWRECRTDNSG